MLIWIQEFVTIRGTKMKRSKTTEVDKTLLTEEGVATTKSVSGATTWRIILRRFRRNEAALIGMAILGFFVLLAPRILIHYVAVIGFVSIFVFEFIRLNTGAKKVVEDTVGTLFKRKEFVEASGLFWLAVAALIVDLFAGLLQRF